MIDYLLERASCRGFLCFNEKGMLLDLNCKTLFKEEFMGPVLTNSQRKALFS